MGAIIEAHGLRKEYAGREVLRGVSLEVDAGELLAVVGPSGSGKSTLLHILGGLDTPTAGEVRLCGRSIAALTPAQLADLRRHTVGLIFQAFQLVPVLSALENAALPGLIAGRSHREATAKAREMLELVGVAARAGQRPAELSGGEQQRVAVARALSMSPALLLADEPTGNLDSKAGGEVIELLDRARRELGQAVVVVTHDDRVAAAATRQLELVDGEILPSAPVDAAPRRRRQLAATR